MKYILIAAAILLGLGIIFGIAIALASHFFKVKEDKRISEVDKMLPGANCGACGYPGCHGLAESIVDKKATPRSCKVAREEAKKLIEEYMKNNPNPVD